eukprot:gnl/TRDRNA2_/TRDRNA2_165176_c0_seq3.p1 gnl/TRDRNA2_/TRDRNA2_165176_c0~~gnl/TRDRNA2_/TRDRNA2_165176_c0_seq3.p1  ORF type:complete len:310 (+),score=43.37 gnl/TRDRNA2_/TRDRNA2_165176_c0_seq3:51-932(+)
MVYSGCLHGERPLCFGWSARALLLTIIWVAAWLPRGFVELTQLLFDRKAVVFFFPSAKACVNGEKPRIALTIDDAPVSTEFDRRQADSCCTAQILDLLSRFDAHATWFIIGSHHEGREALIRRCVQEGHELGNHGMYDRAAWKLGAEQFAEDVGSTQAVLESSGGGQRRWFRPGHALFTFSQLRWLQKQRYRVVIGSVYPHDALDLPPFQCPFPRLIAWHICHKAAAGDVIVIHDRPWTPKALELALPVLAMRFQICTLSELADACEGSRPQSREPQVPNSRRPRQNSPRVTE